MVNGIREIDGAIPKTECMAQVLGTEDGRTVPHPMRRMDSRNPTGVRDTVNRMVEGSSHLEKEVRGGPSWRGDHPEETGQGRETEE